MESVQLSRPDPQRKSSDLRYPLRPEEGHGKHRGDTCRPSKARHALWRLPGGAAGLHGRGQRPEGGVVRRSAVDLARACKLRGQAAWVWLWLPKCPVPRANVAGRGRKGGLPQPGQSPLPFPLFLARKVPFQLPRGAQHVSRRSSGAPRRERTSSISRCRSLIRLLKCDGSLRSCTCFTFGFGSWYLKYPGCREATIAASKFFNVLLEFSISPSCAIPGDRHAPARNPCPRAKTAEAAR